MDLSYLQRLLLLQAVTPMHPLIVVELLEWEMTSHVFQDALVL